METFTPSLDWGDELIASALWVAKAWVIAAVGMVVVLALLARFTTWGRQFWRITGDYFKGRQSVPVWALLGVLLLLVMIDVRFGVLFSYQSNDQFSALQAAFDRSRERRKIAGINGFWMSILIFVGLAIARHRPQSARCVPDAAVHHPLAGVAHPPAHRRLAGRGCLLPGHGSSTIRSTIRTNASSRTSTSSPPAPARKPTRRPSERPKRWCSARFSPSSTWSRSPRFCGVWPDR